MWLFILAKITWFTEHAIKLLSFVKQHILLCSIGFWEKIKTRLSIFQITIAIILLRAYFKIHGKCPTGQKRASHLSNTSWNVYFKLMKIWSISNNRFNHLPPPPTHTHTMVGQKRKLWYLEPLNDFLKKQVTTNMTGSCKISECFA